MLCQDDAGYEEEQKTLEALRNQRSIISAEIKNIVNIDSFLKLVCKYTNIRELTAEVIWEFVEKTYI